MELDHDMIRKTKGRKSYFIFQLLLFKISGFLLLRLLLGRVVCVYGSSPFNDDGRVVK